MNEPSSLNLVEQVAHRRRNLLHTWLLVGGSLILLGVCAFIFAGTAGVLWAGILGAISLWMSTNVSPKMILKLYKARALQPDEFPEIHHIMQALAARAELPAVPKVYYVRSQMMNAFAVGKPDDAVIAMTDALLRGLTLRELVGVLAHEVSHIRSEDLKVMALADVVARMTSVMSWIGLFALLAHLPTAFSQPHTVPWIGIGILLAAPTIGALLQLALSRAREYDADLDAAGLTGDPEGLATALLKLEKYQGRMWEKLALPGSREPQPSVLRSHPKTKHRVDRLMALKPDASPWGHIEFDGDQITPPHGPVPLISRPRYRPLGLWY